MAAVTPALDKLICFAVGYRVRDTPLQRNSEPPDCSLIGLREPGVPRARVSGGAA